MSIKYNGYYKNRNNFEEVEEVVPCMDFFTFRPDGFVYWLSNFEREEANSGSEIVEDIMEYHCVELKLHYRDMALGLYKIKGNQLTAQFWDGFDFYNSIGLGIIRFNIYRFDIKGDELFLKEHFHIRPNEKDTAAIY